MRPVQRRRSTKRITRYGDAKALLIVRLGAYCSYCERRTPYAIEHVLPWGDRQVGTAAAPLTLPQHPRLQNSWTNFLLTCVTCNNFKARRQDATPQSDRRQARRRYYWPDTDNTFRAYKYYPTGDVVAHPNLGGPEAAKAARTLEMFGFGSPGDERKLSRADVWACAEVQLRVWTRAPSEQTLDEIASVINIGGHWSIWRTVFAAHPRVLDRLNQMFRGTARCCFDPHSGATIARRKGQL